MSSFKTLGLCAELLRAIQEQNYHQPTPVQQQAIPVILSSQDVMAAAETGTGKTAGFTLPLLQRLSETHAANSKHRPVRALILTPTRELAAQVSDSVATYGKYLSLTSAVVFGGVNINPQIAQLRRGVDILIATPGRLLDLVNQKVAHLSNVEILVLDEADRMLDMGFINDIRKILPLLPKKRQNLLFSATFSTEIKTLAKTILHQPALIEVARPNTTAKGITQVVHLVEQNRKRELLSFMIGSKNWRQVLVFTRTKHGANRLTEQLITDGLSAAAIHGNKSQGARTKALEDFKKGKIRVLVATDIAARGLDIDKLPHVVNYELPNVPEDYVHRIGRTGRAQQEGIAISLVGSHEFPFLKDIENLLKYKLPQEVIPGYESDASYKNDLTHKSDPRKSTKARHDSRRDKQHATDERQPRKSNAKFGGAEGSRRSPGRRDRHDSSAKQSEGRDRYSEGGSNSNRTKKAATTRFEHHDRSNRAFEKQGMKQDRSSGFARGGNAKNYNPAEDRFSDSYGNSERGSLSKRRDSMVFSTEQPRAAKRRGSTENRRHQIAGTGSKTRWSTDDRYGSSSGERSAKPNHRSSRPSNSGRPNRFKPKVK